MVILPHAAELKESRLDKQLYSLKAKKLFKLSL